MHAHRPLTSTVLVLVLAIEVAGAAAIGDRPTDNDEQAQEFAVLLALTMAEASRLYEMPLTHMRRGFNDALQEDQPRVSPADAPLLMETQIMVTNGADPVAVDRRGVARTQPLDWSLNEKASYAYGMMVVHRIQRNPSLSSDDHETVAQAVLDELGHDE